MSGSTAPGATWRTRSRNSSWISSPTGPRRRASPPTSSGSSSPPSRRSSSAPSGACSTAPGSPAPPQQRSGSSSSRSVPASPSPYAGSRSPWTPHTPRPPPSHGSTHDCERSLPPHFRLLPISRDHCAPASTRPVHPPRDPVAVPLQQPPTGPFTLPSTLTSDPPPHSRLPKTASRHRMRNAG